MPPWKPPPPPPWKPPPPRPAWATSANASPTIALARITASANEICLPHAALSIFSSTLIDGGSQGRQRQRLPEQHSRSSISSASEISAHADVNFGTRCLRLIVKYGS